MAVIATAMASQPFLACAETLESGQTIDITLRPAQGANHRINFDNGTPQDQMGRPKEFKGSLPTHPPTAYRRETPAGMFYYDANHDGKMNAVQSHFDGHVSARGLRVSSAVDGIVVPYVVDLFTYPHANSGWLDVQTCWESSFDIGGKTWLIRIVDPLNGVIDERAELTLTEKQPGVAKSVHRLAANVPKRLVVGDRCFDIGFAFQSTGQGTVLKALLKEVPVPMCQVVLQGRFIHTLALRSGKLLAVFEKPGPTILLPAGEYIVERVALDTLPSFHGFSLDLNDEFRSSGLSATGKGMEKIFVREDGPTVLKIGGPLRNVVTIGQQAGSAFAAHYHLLGAGGEEYLFGTGADNGRPWLNTYMAGVRIASTQLPFG